MADQDIQAEEPKIQININKSNAGDLISILIVSPVALNNMQISNVLESLSKGILTADERPQDTTANPS